MALSACILSTCLVLSFSREDSDLQSIVYLPSLACWKYLDFCCLPNNSVKFCKKKKNTNIWRYRSQSSQKLLNLEFFSFSYITFSPIFLSSEAISISLHHMPACIFRTELLAAEWVPRKACQYLLLLNRRELTGTCSVECSRVFNELLFNENFPARCKNAIYQLTHKM